MLVYVGQVDGKRKYKSFTAPTKKEAEYQAALYGIRLKKTSIAGLGVGVAIDK